MTVSSAKYLKGFYSAAKALGAKSINSDAWMDIEGHSEMGLLTKQFPWPTLGSQGEIEVPGPLGTKSWQPQQIQLAQQGAIAFSETDIGHVMNFMTNVTLSGTGQFNATVYEGTPDKFKRAYKLVDCLFVPDAADRDWENRAQVTIINGTLFFHFFGEAIPGNDVAN